MDQEQEKKEEYRRKLVWIIGGVVLVLGLCGGAYYLYDKKEQSSPSKYDFEFY